MGFGRGKVMIGSVNYYDLPPRETRYSDRSKLQRRRNASPPTLSRRYPQKNPRCKRGFFGKRIEVPGLFRSGSRSRIRPGIGIRFFRFRLLRVFPVLLSFAFSLRVGGSRRLRGRGLSRRCR